VVTEAWLTQQPPETVSIQLLGTSDAVQLKAQLEKLAREVAIDNVYVYRTKVNNLPFLTVLYGSYVDRRQAIMALKDLPLSVQKYRPQLRTIAGVLQETN
jgi:MSHA biogenesis protein MshM